MMESGTKNQDPHSPYIRSPTEQPPLQKNSFEERGSDVEEKPFQEDGKNFSSRLRENRTERRGLEPKTDKEENSKKTELKGRSNCLARSEAERCSNRESSSKRKNSSRDSPVDRTGASVDERSVTLEKKKRKVPDAGPSGDSEETWDARPRKAQRGSTGRSKRRRYRSPGIQPPPLRKSLVTSLRAMSEAIYQDVVQIQNQWVPSSLNWEQLAQLRGRLCAQAQTFYTMATQAAYAFPAEGWLVPAPLPGPWRPAENGETQSSS